MLIPLGGDSLATWPVAGPCRAGPGPSAGRGGKPARTPGKAHRPSPATIQDTGQTIAADSTSRCTR